MPNGPQGQNSYVRKAHNVFRKFPLRLKALLLCVVVLLPVMFVATRFFPPQDRNTILVISCFGLAAAYAFFGMGGRNRTKNPNSQKCP
jgi:hypothetical protein